MPPHLRLIGLTGTIIIGLGSKVAEAVSDPSSAQGFALAATISAAGAAAVAIIGAITNMIVKLRRVQPARRRKSKAQLLRERAHLDEQLAALEED